MTTLKVVVTGATGQVAYALLPRIAAGEMFGPDVEIDLRLAVVLRNDRDRLACCRARRRWWRRQRWMLG